MLADAQILAGPDVRERKEVLMMSSCGVRRASGLVWCEKHQCKAVVSAVERADSPVPEGYVQWCSLRIEPETCSEECLEQFRRGTTSHEPQDG